MTRDTHLVRPPYIDEEIFLQHMLHALLDQADQGLSPALRIGEKKTPELFDFDNEDPIYLWTLIKQLKNEYGLLNITLSRTAKHQQEYAGAQIGLNLDKQALLRDWLMRPVFDSQLYNWNNSVYKHADKFEDLGHSLLDNPVAVEGLTAEAIVEGFACVALELVEPMTLRQLSARCFWGDSKFLDHHQHENMLKELYPSLMSLVQPRPLLMHIALAETKPDQILLIENQDSFLYLAQMRDQLPMISHAALVYCAGFRGTANRIRQREAMVFSHIAAVSEESAAYFSGCWFADSEVELPTYFWGDLDYSGMAILQALAHSFPTVQAWQPGYRYLLARLQADFGHGALSTDKTAQRDPGYTGCEFTDTELLPALREGKQFIDQECVAVKHLMLSTSRDAG